MSAHLSSTAVRTRAAIARLLLLAAALLLGGLAPAAWAADATVAVKANSPSLGGFSARALGPDGEVTPQTYFSVKLAPGGTFSGKLLVTNSANHGSRLRVYSVDGLTGETTGTVYANLNDPHRGASLWITPEKARLRLQKKSNRTVGFRVQVPGDATPGDHVGAIALQAFITKRVKGQFGVTEVIRVAVAVQITVEGPANAAMKLGRLGIKALGGTQIPSVSVGIDNTGELLCRPSLKVVLSQDGTTIGTVTRQLDTILPTASIAYPLPWPKPLPAGKYHALANATGCGATVQAESDVELRGALVGSTKAPGTNIAPKAASTGVPWWVLLIAVLAALVGGFFLARRKPKEQVPAPPAAAPPVA